MSEVEERLASPRPFGMDSVQAVCTRAVTAVFQMVRELNALSDNAYLPLQEAFERIRAQMEALLEEPPHPEGPLVLPLPLVRLEDMPQVGGKMANLGEVAAHAGLPAPDGFAVTVAAYYRFMEYSGLREELSRRIQATDMQSLDAVFSLSAALQQAVLAAPPASGTGKSHDRTGGGHTGADRRGAASGPAQQRRGRRRPGRDLCRTVPFRTERAARRSL